MRIMTEGPRPGVLRALTLATGLIAALCLPLTAKEKKPSAKQLDSFRAAKTARIVIDKKVKTSFENKAYSQSHRRDIREDAISFIRSLGLRLVEKDPDLTLKIDKIRVDPASRSKGQSGAPRDDLKVVSRAESSSPVPGNRARGMEPVVEETNTDQRHRATYRETRDWERLPELPKASDFEPIRQKSRPSGYTKSKCRITLKSPGVSKFDVRYEIEGPYFGGNFNDFDSTLSLLLESIWPLGEGEVRSTGVVIEPNTGLSWTYDDNDSDITWTKAESYCANLSAGGYKNWRLPTIEELGQLDSLLVRVTSRYVWSSTKNSEASAFNFDFELGARSSYLLAGSSRRRALCVCSSKE